MEKASTVGVLTQYPYLQLDQQVCHPHYMAIVEGNLKHFNEGNKKNVIHGNNFKKDYSCTPI
jgi:hypothetical protein